MFDRAELNKIIAMAKDRGIWVITDECYDRFLYDGEPYRWLTRAEGHGDRGGIAVEDIRDDRLAYRLRAGSAAVVSGIGKLQSIRRRTRPRSHRRRPSRHCAARRIRCGIMLAEFRKRRDYVIDRLRPMPGVKVQVPQGAFYAYPERERGL